MYTLTTLNGRGVFNFDGSDTQNPQSRTNTGSGLADLEPASLGKSKPLSPAPFGLSNLRANNDFCFCYDD